jgi:hypothetical protein
LKLNLIPAFLLAIIYCTALSGQSRIKDFTAVQYKENVQVNFTISPGQSCTGYQIQRSDNLTDFETLYDFSGICGDAVKAQAVSFTDAAPLKIPVSYYRAFIPPADYSEAVTINYLEFPSTGYILFSNPVSGPLKVLVNSRLATLELFNAKGEKLLELTSDGKGLLTTDLSNFQNGLYYFLIKTEEGRLLKGRFIKE